MAYSNVMRDWSDPIGPGTKAWIAFDRALECWQAAGDGRRDSSRNPVYKRYSNQRAAMITALRRAGADDMVIAQWLAELRMRIACKDWEELV